MTTPSGPATGLRRAALGAATAILVTAATATVAAPAFADVPGGKTSGSGDDKGNLSAGVQVTYPTDTSTKGSGGHSLGAADNVTWTPPPCWIGPVAGPAEFKKMVEKQVKETNEYPGQANYAMQAMDEYKKHYSEGRTWSGNGEKAYKNFNLDQQGKGAFWGPVTNPNSDSPDRFDCNGTLPFWVPNGQRPPAGTPNVITTEMLARLAFAHTKVPGVDIRTNPVGTQTVNLPTWVTLNENYAPVTVRAELNIPGAQAMWAETTATPTSVHIDPGTSDATVYPSSAECPIGKGGQVGAPYTEGATGNPPCGVTYRRSTQSTGAYDLNVTATWKVSWRGSDGAADNPPLPNGVITQDHPVTVQEIQTVNR
ncbi:hypothetical protein ACIOC1_07420 [Streptomyces sp. NPDC088197]|uniref:hypothetical protein n=1 Tax=unclassified Streptomyces TaxID=2593676 RepID=UPI0038026225